MWGVVLIAWSLVFHVTDQLGNKLTDDTLIHYIQEVCFLYQNQIMLLVNSIIKKKKKPMMLFLNRVYVQVGRHLGRGPPHQPFAIKPSPETRQHNTWHSR